MGCPAKARFYPIGRSSKIVENRSEAVCHASMWRLARYANQVAARLVPAFRFDELGRSGWVAQASRNADTFKGFAEECMAEYDLDGWKVADLTDPGAQLSPNETIARVDGA